MAIDTAGLDGGPYGERLVELIGLLEAAIALNLDEIDERFAAIMGPGIERFETITRTAYDALPTPNPTTLYIINEAE